MNDDSRVRPVPEAIPSHLAVAEPPASAADLAGFDAEAAEQQAEAALASGAELLPHHDLLGFYDRLRPRVLETIERRAGRLPEDVVIALLLAPDIFILLVRLVMDKEVPRRARLLIGGAIAYWISPIDLLPELFLGPIGYLDDLVVAVAVVAQVFTGDLEPYARKHWTGRQDLHVVLHDISAAAHGLLGSALHARLKRLLARHGITLDDTRKRGG
ncbi:MAG TPA: DUF1232 domain-containing protein [Thermoanaerobaculia bacterium]|nr:DUF1232 domain-containing protein [Thermoanaerobaculia bacterium]